MKGEMSNPAERSGKPVIIMVILLLAVAIIYSSFSTTAVFAVAPGWIMGVGRNVDCSSSVADLEPGGTVTCCWSEDTGIDSVVERYCQTCVSDPAPPGLLECDQKVKQKTVGGGGDIVPPLEEGLAPRPPPGPGQGGSGNVLPEGVLEEPETAPIPEGHTGLTPQVDCAQNPQDPLCETATIPEGEIDNETQGRLIGQPSPTGYCVPLRTPTCIPCDPGLPGADCIPQTEWPPTRTTDTGTPEEAAPLVPPVTEETAPQVAPQDDAELPPCPPGEVTTANCIPQDNGGGDESEEEPSSEEEQQPQVEEEEPQPEEDQSTEENSDN